MLKIMSRLCYTIISSEKCGWLSRKCGILSQCFHNSCISLVTSQVKKYDTKTDKLVAKPHVRDTTKHYKEIVDYLNSKECLRNLIPQIKDKFINKRYKYPDSQCLIDKEIAMELIGEIKSELLKDSSHIFEINPGYGVITEQLLLNGIKDLHIFESDPTFLLNISALGVLHNIKIELRKVNFLHLGSITYQDKCDNGGRFENIMKDVKRREWDDSPVIKLIGVIPPSLNGKYDLIKCLMFDIIFQSGLVTYGRPELYVIMRPAPYLQLTCNSDAGYLLYRLSTVMFTLFFESKIIKKIPQTAVLPWSFKYVRKKREKLHKVNVVDADKLYFVKITPRPDLFSIIRPDMLKPFWFFLRHNMLSRKNKVIPMMEIWVPGCGPRLIADGFTIFTEFGDLTPLQLLELFKIFTTWPEFNSCPFLASMETTLLKMLPENLDSLEGDRSDDDNDNDDDDDQIVERKLREKLKK